MNSCCYLQIKSRSIALTDTKWTTYIKPYFCIWILVYSINIIKFTSSHTFYSDCLCLVKLLHTCGWRLHAFLTLDLLKVDFCGSLSTASSYSNAKLQCHYSISSICVLSLFINFEMNILIVGYWYVYLSGRAQQAPRPCLAYILSYATDLKSCCPLIYYVITMYVGYKK